MAFKRRYLEGTSGLLQSINTLSSRIDVHDTDIATLKNFNGLSSSNVTMYVAPATASDSCTYTTTDKTTKLVGNDTTGTGAIDKPFATVKRAISELKSVRASSSIVFAVYLHAGTYRQTWEEALSTANTIDLVTTGGDLWVPRHYDTAKGSGCYFLFNGYDWSGHTIQNPNDTTSTLISSSDCSGISGAETVTLRNQVVIDITSRYAPSGGFAPFAIYSPARFQYLTFKIHPGYGNYTKAFTNIYPIHQYSGESMEFQYCKFYNFPNRTLQVNEGSFTNTNVAATCKYCLFDNEEVYKNFSRTANGYCGTNGEMYPFCCSFRYFVNAIYIPAGTVQTHMPPTYKYVNGTLTSVYPVNICKFEECQRGIWCQSFASNGETPGNSSPGINFYPIFTNNVVTRISKVRVGTTEYE